MIRTLEEVCDAEDFTIIILDNTYCSLALNKKIRCEYQSAEKDHNGLYICLNPKYNVKDYEGTKQ